MFNPVYAGLPGEFCCIDNGVFIAPEADEWILQYRTLIPGLQSCLKLNKLGQPPYLLGTDIEGTLKLFVPCAADIIEYEKSCEGLLPKSFFRVALDYRRSSVNQISKRGILFSNAFLLWSYILMFGYLYYERCISVVSDEYFDQLCKAMRHRLDQGYTISGHAHEHLFNPEQLEAGSVHDLVGKFPFLVKNSADVLEEKVTILD